jgi:hypothetical protein
MSPGPLELHGTLRGARDVNDGLSWRCMSFTEKCAQDCGWREVGGRRTLGVAVEQRRRSEADDGGSPRPGVLPSARPFCPSSFHVCSGSPRLFIWHSDTVTWQHGQVDHHSPFNVTTCLMTCATVEVRSTACPAFASF